MSADDSKSVGLKGVTHGAVDNITKPVHIEALKNIWQHAVREKQDVSEHSGSVEETGGDMQQQQRDDDNDVDGDNEGMKRKDEEVEEQVDDKEEDTSSLKKPRLAWSVELHQQFVAAVDHLGVDKAVPKKILKMMNVPGLTREKIASHLQKYRIYLRRLGGASQHQARMNHSFTSSQDPSFSLLNGFDPQALADGGQLPSQSLAQLQAAGPSRWSSSLIKPGIMSAAQRSILSFENSKSRFGDGRGQMMMMNGGNGNKQKSLLHGVPTSHMRLLQQQQMAGMRVADQRGGPPMQHQQQQSMLPRRSLLTDGVVVRNSSRVLPPTTHSVFNNSFPLASAPAAAGFGNLSYDIYNDFPQQQQHNRVNEWNLRNMGMVFNSHQDTASTFPTSEAYSSFYTHKRKREAELMAEHGQNQQQQAQRRRVNHMNQVYMNGGGSVRMKSETVTCPPHATTMMFHEQYNQEDLMNALLKQEGFPLIDNEFDYEGYSIDNIPV